MSDVRRPGRPLAEQAGRQTQPAARILPTPCGHRRIAVQSGTSSGAPRSAPDQNDTISCQVMRLSGRDVVWQDGCNSSRRRALHLT